MRDKIRGQIVKESEIQQLVRLKASQLGAILWRNNQGAYKDPKGYYIRYGVCNPGGSDLIGIFKGRFLAIECKVPGKNANPEQQSFIDMVNKLGGIAAVITNPDQLENILK